MAKTNQNFSLYAKTDRTIAIKLDEDTPDLTGAEAQWWLGTSVDADDDEVGEVLLKKSTVPGEGMVITQEDGRYVLMISITGEDTDDLEGEYYHEARITVDGQTYIVSTGTVRMKPVMH